MKNMLSILSFIALNFKHFHPSWTTREGCQLVACGETHYFPQQSGRKVKYGTLTDTLLEAVEPKRFNDMWSKSRISLANYSFKFIQRHRDKGCLGYHQISHKSGNADDRVPFDSNTKL